MGRRRFACSHVLLWLLLARAVSASPLLDTIPEMKQVGDNAVSHSSETPETVFRNLLSDVGQYVEAAQDVEHADGPGLLLQWLQPSNSQSSVKAFIEHVKNSPITELVTLWEVPDVPAQSEPSGNNTSPGVCERQGTEASIKPLSPLAILAIVLPILITLVAAVWYVSKRYIFRYWDFIQLLSQLEGTNAFERLRNQQEIELTPVTTATSAV